MPHGKAAVGRERDRGQDLDGLLQSLGLPNAQASVDRDQEELIRLQSENLALKSELIEIKVALNRSRASKDGDAGSNPPALLAKTLQDAAQALQTASLRLRRMGEASRALVDRLREREAEARAGEVRVREMSHRIKNSLQLIVSLLRLRNRDPKSIEAQDALAVATACIEAVARVHALLCAAPATTEEIAFNRYLDEVGRCLGQLHDADGRHRNLVVQAEPLTLPADTAQTLGLLVSELVLNAFRHAFAPDAPGTVWIRAAGDAEGRLRLTVADDGKGWPEGVEQGTGVGLVDLLAKQIGATIDVDRESGTRVTLTVPLP